MRTKYLFLFFVTIITFGSCNDYRVEQRLCGLWECKSDHSQILITPNGIRSSLVHNMLWQKSFGFSDDSDIGLCELIWSDLHYGDKIPPRKRFHGSISVAKYNNVRWNLKLKGKNLFFYLDDGEAPHEYVRISKNTAHYNDNKKKYDCFIGLWEVDYFFSEDNKSWLFISIDNDKIVLTSEIESKLEELDFIILGSPNIISNQLKKNDKYYLLAEIKNGFPLALFYDNDTKKMQLYNNGKIVAECLKCKSGSTEIEYERILEKRKQELIELDKNDPHKFVDLGLSVKWATCNIGANSPEEFGDYYAWGEIEKKSNFDFTKDKYKFLKKRSDEYYLTKYYFSEDPTKNKTELEPADDVATVLWGERWRIPTRSEYEELLANCTFTPIDEVIDGKRMVGTKVTSTVEGYEDKSIFFPYSGSVSVVVATGTFFESWTRSLPDDERSHNKAYYFSSNRNGQYIGTNYRHRGLTVRPVHL